MKSLLDNSNDWLDAPLQYYHFFTDKKQTNGNYLTARNEFLKNEHCIISTATFSEDTEIFFPQQLYALNSYFIHHGSGEFLSEYGRLTR